MDIQVEGTKVSIYLDAANEHLLVTSLYKRIAASGNEIANDRA